MFNKLKVKVAEEVKNSHQRLQQFTQSFTEKVENAPSEENFFTIGDDDGQTSSSNTESGFSNVPLTSYSSVSNSGHHRRSSNTSIASDVSFLPHYDSPTNLYHMQSDLDISASEVEDNASSSSQLGHLTKEQIYSAFQKAQLRYHKYRGRYTDVAKHYKDLERENNKIRSVLVETQDKALRRISELREQCSLEQRAKAHLENSLRLDLDEKQYLIDSLQTKVNLLQNHNNTEWDKSNLTNVVESASNNELPSYDVEALTKDLKDARTEIENLNEKIQEMKANSIIFNSKITDFKKKITELEEINKQKNVELSEVLERERENNLIIAQTKMELHTEIQNRDLEIENLKHDVETLKSDLDVYETKLKSTKTNKVDNFQTQNTKLIERVEELTQKCNKYESDLLQMNQLKIENQCLHDSLEINNKQVGEYEKCIQEKDALLLQEKETCESELSSLKEDAKQSLLTLESKIKEKLQNEFIIKEDALTSAFQTKIQHLTEADETRETQLKLIDQAAEIKNLETKQKELEKVVQNEKERYRNLESNHLDLISESSKVRNELIGLQNNNQELLNEIVKLENEIQQNLVLSQNNTSALCNEKTNLQNEIETIQISNVTLQNEVTKIRKDFDTLKTSNTLLQNENIELHSNNKEHLQLSAEHKQLNGLNTDLQNKITKLETEHLHFIKLNETVSELSAQCSNLKQQLDTALQRNHDYEKQLADKQNDSKTELEHLEKAANELRINLKDVENQKVEAQNRLKDDTVKFRNEIENLKNEISQFKENYIIIQSYVDKYKLKLAEYIANSSETETRIRNLTDDNATLNSEIVRLNETLDSSCSVNANLTQQLNDLMQENKRMCITEKLIDEYIDDNTATFPDKIKFIAESNLKLKDQNLLQKEDNKNLNTQLNEILNKNEILTEQIKQLETEISSNYQNYEGIKLEVVQYKEKCKTLDDELAVLNTNLASYKEELSNLQSIENDYQTLQSEKDLLQETVIQINTENSKLSTEISKLDEQGRIEIQEAKDENSRISEEISELKHRNSELLLDYKQITSENEEIVTELAETKLKLETVSTEKLKYLENVKKIDIEKVQLLNELKQYRNELDRLKTTTIELENIQEVENLITDNKNLKLQLVQLEQRCESYVKQQRILDGQLRELENQYTEISHEKQLLQDEIQEFKILPINAINDQTSNDGDNHQQEIEDLNEKLVQYKSLDLTNRSSLQFYENELQKLRNKNEKLNRKLDETLVTLNHCAELSQSTETEYLKNVLYNYMLGKESVVLARVIAAVCKFDESQTSAILQREQQKQTLLGQLGLL